MQFPKIDAYIAKGTAAYIRKKSIIEDIFQNIKKSKKFYPLRKALLYT